MNKLTNICFLKLQPEFESVSEDILCEFLENGVFMRFPPGHGISQKGTTCNSVFMIVNGNVKAELHDDVFGDVILVPGDFFDLVSFCTRASSKVSFSSDTEVAAYSWQVSYIDSLLAKYPEMYHCFSRLMANSLERFHEKKVTYLQKQYEIKIRANDAQHFSDDKVEALYELREILSSFESVEQLFQTVIDIVPRAFKAGGCILRLLDENENVLRIEAASGEDGKLVKGKIQKVGHGVAGWVAQTGKAALINDISKDKRFSQNTEAISSSLINVPLKIKGEVIGTLTVFDKKLPDSQFVDFDAKLLATVGNQVAVALENLRLSDKIESVNENWQNALKEKLTLIKKAPVFRKVFPKVMATAEDNLPITILGEDGSGKFVLAEVVHYLSLRRSEEFVYVDCNKIHESSMGEEIFGLDGKKGSLENAHKGSICLDNFECLNRMNQAKILYFLKNKYFSPVGRSVKKISDVKIIFLSSKNAESIFSCESLTHELKEYLKSDFIYVPSLRERSRDLPILIDYFIGRISSESHCSIKKLSPEALGLLLNYSWPGNIKELEGVLSRAVMLAEGDTINRNNIMFGLPGVEEKNEFNLLRIPIIKKIFESKLYPNIFKFFTVFIASTIIYSSFWGTQIVSKNFALWICWSVGWPLLFVSFIFVGRIWCGICPFHFVGKNIKKIINLELETPQWVRKNKYWLGFVFCLFIIWFERASHIYSSPFFTGILLLIILVGASVCAAIFKRRIWCLYICPWGALNRILSACSITSIRANHSICYSKCGKHLCHIGKGDKEGCVMEQHPYKLDPKDCVMCGNCIKICDYQAILLSIRPLGKSLWKWSENHFSDSLLGISLATVLLVDKFLGTEYYMNHAPGFMLNYDSFYYSVFFLIGVFFSYIILKKMGSVISDNEDEEKQFSGKVGYAFIPLSLFGFLVYYLPQFGYNVHAALLSLGIFMSIYTMWKILSRKSGNIKKKAFVFSVLILYSVVFLILL